MESQLGIYAYRQQLGAVPPLVNGEDIADCIHGDKTYRGSSPPPNSPASFLLYLKYAFIINNGFFSIRREGFSVGGGGVMFHCQRGVCGPLGRWGLAAEGNEDNFPFFKYNIWYVTSYSSMKKFEISGNFGTFSFVIRWYKVVWQFLVNALNGWGSLVQYLTLTVEYSDVS